MTATFVVMIIDDSKHECIHGGGFVFNVDSVLALLVDQGSQR